MATHCRKRRSSAMPNKSRPKPCLVLNVTRCQLAPPVTLIGDRHERRHRRTEVLLAPSLRAKKKLLQLAASSDNIPGVFLGLSDCTLGRDCYLLGRHQLLMFIWSAVRFIWMVAAGLPTPNSARFGSRRGSSFVENRWSHIHHERTCKAQRTDWFRMAAAVTPRRTIISKRARGRFRSSLLTVANRNMPAKQKAKM
jgi:hypothetical protein